MPDEVWAALNSDDPEQRLDAIGACVLQLYQLLVEETPPRRTRKRIPPGMQDAALQSAAFRARVGRAAARMGMSMDDFVDKYGWVDRVPEVG